MACAPLVVEVEGLSFRYPDGTLALRGADLTVCEGERLALLGSNGAGKSTLLLHLNGLLAGSGRVSVLGLEVSERNVERIRQQVGLLFQNPDDQLFLPTVADEVAFAALNARYCPEEVRARVAEALETVGMSGSEQKHPINLSLGQKKRVALASVLVTDNRVLVLDEPSSGLDPAGRRSLIALLRKLPATQIIATHDLDLAAALCDRAAVMQEGRIVRAGPADEVLSDAGFLLACGL